MSINKFQEKIFRTGCGTTVLYISAGVFFAGMFYMGCGMGGNQQGNGQQKQPPIVTVGDQPINVEAFQTGVQNQIEDMRRQNPDVTSPDSVSPSDEAQTVGKSLSDAVDGLGYFYLAKHAGVKFTDSLLKEELEKTLEENVFAFKMQNASRFKLPQDASDKQFDDVLVKQKQPTLTSMRQSAEKQIGAQLKDPDARPGLEMAFAKKFYTNALRDKLAPTDDQLKASYDTYTFKKVLFGADSGATADAQIAKAQADLKNGQTFEHVMEQYSKEPPLKGKKVSDNTESMDASELDHSPVDAPLKSLKPGEVSGVIDDISGKAIYKLISVKNSAPPDLLKNKAKYIEQYTQPKAETEAAANLKALLNSKAVTWNSEGYKAMFDWYQAHTDFSNPEPLATRVVPIIDEAKKASQTNQGYDARAALLAWFAAFTDEWSAPTADKVKLRPDRIELLKAITQDTSYESLKLELVDLETESKSPEAGSALLDAAQSNTEYDPHGQQVFQDINTKLQQLKDLKIVNADEEKKIQAAQDEWVKENQSEEDQKAQARAAQAEQAKQDAALKAEQLAEQAKAKADLDKKNKANPPAAGKPGTTGTTAGSLPATTAGAPAGTSGTTGTAPATTAGATGTAPAPATTGSAQTGTTPAPGKKQ